MCLYISLWNINKIGMYNDYKHFGTVEKNKKFELMLTRHAKV